MKNKYFIAIYTHECKDYCDKKFFAWIHYICEGNPVYIVDNSKGYNYLTRLAEITEGFNFNLYKLTVEQQPKKTLFLRNVADSVNLLRDKFLKSDCDYFLIIESDVLPPEDMIAKFDYATYYLNKNDPDDFDVEKKKPWGIVGGHYYKGFHDYSSMKGLYPTHHALSGCTVYKRELIEKYPFRWSEENLGAFPDAWICVDAGQEYNIYNDGSIECEHLEIAPGQRQSRSL